MSHHHHQHQQHHNQHHQHHEPTATRLDTKPNNNNNSSCLIVGHERCSPHGGEHSLANSSSSGRGQQVVLTLSQLNGNAAAGGLVILNSKTKSFESPSAIMPYIRLSSPPIIKSPSPGLDQDVSSAATRGDLGSVSAAVNTLNNIQDFGLHHLHGPEFDSSPYPGVQPVTDSLLSGSESQKSEDSSIKSEADNCSGRLLDFKSAFSDLESKPDMSFLDLSQDDLHRTLSANIPLSSDQQVKTNNSGGGGYYRQNQRLNVNQMVGSEANFGGSDNHLFYHNPAFDLNLDSFDILSDFPDSTPHNYDGSIVESGQHGGGGVGGGGGGSQMNNNGSHVGATIKTRTLEYRENLVTITDYSPNWSYTDVSIRIHLLTFKVNIKYIYEYI